MCSSAFNIELNGLNVKLCVAASEREGGEKQRERERERDRERERNRETERERERERKKRERKTDRHTDRHRQRGRPAIVRFSASLTGRELQLSAFSVFCLLIETQSLNIDNGTETTQKAFVRGLRDEREKSS